MRADCLYYLIWSDYSFHLVLFVQCSVDNMLTKIKGYIAVSGFKRSLFIILQPCMNSLSPLMWSWSSQTWSSVCAPVLFIVFFFFLNPTSLHIRLGICIQLLYVQPRSVTTSSRCERRITIGRCNIWARFIFAIVRVCMKNPMDAYVDNGIYSIEFTFYYLDCVPLSTNILGKKEWGMNYISIKCWGGGVCLEYHFSCDIGLAFNSSKLVDIPEKNQNKRIKDFFFFLNMFWICVKISKIRIDMQ